MKKNNKTILSIFFSYCFVFGYSFYYSVQQLDTPYHSVLNFILWLVCFYFLKRSSKWNDGGEKTKYFLISFLFSIALFFGKAINETNSLSTLLYPKFKIIGLVVSIVGFIWFMSPVLRYGIESVFEAVGKLSSVDFKSFDNVLRNLFFIWGIIFVSWIPALLALYPGVFSYDSNMQTMQAIEGIKDKHHPPLHTMLWKMCMNVGKHFDAEPLFIYSLLQILIFSFCLAVTIHYLKKRNVCNCLVLLSLLYFMLNPVISIFSVIMTKDVIFSGLFILLLIQCIDIVSDPEKYLSKWKNWLIFILLSLVGALLKNNAIFAFLITMLLFVLFVRKQRGRLIVLTILTTFLYFLINNGLYESMGITEKDEKEALSVPIQQISRAVVEHGDELDQNLLLEIDNYIPSHYIKDNYNPRFADPVKCRFNNVYYRENKAEFYQLWLKLFVQYPRAYIDAFLSLNLPYWYPDADSIDQYSEREYIEINNIGSFYHLVGRETKLPLLLEFYEKVADYSLFSNVPIISNLFSIASPIWFLLISILALWVKNNGGFVLPLILPVSLWLTHIAGPVSNLRYVFPIIVMYPVIFSLGFQTDRFKKISGKDYDTA